MLQAISPIDGRYADKTAILSNYFSEYALFKYRLFVELEYLKALAQTDVLQIKDKAHFTLCLDNCYNTFSIDEAQQIKLIEKETRHDIKALEYYIKSYLDKTEYASLKEWIHIGLTSQDINNTATPLMMRDVTQQCLVPELETLKSALSDVSAAWRSVPMLAHTHGQVASPTTMGKEIFVFVERLDIQLQGLKTIMFTGKFGGATGNFNAHRVAFPNTNWPQWADEFLKHNLGISRQQTTTQIAHYDEIASWCHNLIRINTILIDLCRDMWTYISMDYIKQKTVKNEIGSSAMPHKVNPIDFENAEGNFGIANANLSFFAEKLPLSRLQRDLTDSTVLRNLGVPCGHMLIALKSLRTGLQKIELHTQHIEVELMENWAVISEGIQTILRKEGCPQPYEKLKELTRGKGVISQKDVITFIDTLEVSDEIKQQLKAIRPDTYIGYSK